MPTFDGSNSLTFVKVLHRNFCETLADAPGRIEPIGGLTEACFRIFGRNSEHTRQGSRVMAAARAAAP